MHSVSGLLILVLATSSATAQETQDFSRSAWIEHNWQRGVEFGPDGGLHWENPVEVSGSAVDFNDKEALTIDTHPDSRYLGRVYVDPITFLSSRDNGRTWSNPRLVSAAPLDTATELAERAETSAESRPLELLDDDPLTPITGFKTVAEESLDDLVGTDIGPRIAGLEVEVPVRPATGQ
jgi:hypothetical protein